MAETKTISNTRKQRPLPRETVEELQLLKQYKPCIGFSRESADNPGYKSQLQQYVDINLSGIDGKMVQKLLSENFTNADILQLISCISNVIFFGTNGQDSPIQYNKLHRYFRNLRSLGVRGAAGFPSKANFGSDHEDANDIFIIKALNDDEEPEGLTHELFVATFGLNKLRQEIPNFAYVFGGLSCTQPWIETRGLKKISDPVNKLAVQPFIPPQNSVTYWCEKEDQAIQYVFYENIAPAISFRDAIGNMNEERFLNYYLQILFSLRLANKRCKFTHYDLHADNALLRFVKPNGNDSKDAKGFKGQKFSIRYETSDGVLEYLATDAVASFIDYGYSHITYQGNHYGKYGLKNFGVFPDKDYILFDAYKFLMFCAFSANEEPKSPKTSKLAKELPKESKKPSPRNPAVVSVCQQIYPFFAPAFKGQQKAFNQMLTIKEAEKFYVLPYHEGKNFDLDTLISFIRGKFKCPFLTVEESRDAPLLESVLERDDFAGQIGLLAPNPKNIFDFDDLLQKISKRAPVNYTPKASTYDMLLNDIDTEILYLSTILKQGCDSCFEAKGFEFTEMFAKRFADSVSNIIIIVDAQVRRTSYLNSISNVLKESNVLQRLDPSKDTLQFLNELSGMKDRLNAMSEDYRELVNTSYARTLKISQMVTSFLKKYYDPDNKLLESLSNTVKTFNNII